LELTIATTLNGVAQVACLDDSHPVVGRRGPSYNLTETDAEFSGMEPPKIRDLRQFPTLNDALNSFPTQLVTGLQVSTYRIPLSPKALASIAVGGYRDTASTYYDCCFDGSARYATAPCYNPWFGYAQTGGSFIIVNAAASDSLTISCHFHGSVAIVPANAANTTTSSNMVLISDLLCAGRPNMNGLRNLHNVIPPMGGRVPNVAPMCIAHVGQVVRHDDTDWWDRAAQVVAACASGVSSAADKAINFFENTKLGQRLANRLINTAWGGLPEGLGPEGATDPISLASSRIRTITNFA